MVRWLKISKTLGIKIRFKHNYRQLTVIVQQNKLKIIIMKNQTSKVNPIRKYYKQNASRFVLIFAVLLFTCSVVQAQTEWPQMVYSKDGTPISYKVYGNGEPTLVFIHGWSCDSRYWQNQISAFSKNNKIVLVDLAGHGHSGMNRKKYTMEAFGEDVKAVVENMGCQNCILIGHSMGGEVIAEAALLMPERVIGLIGVDTYHDVAYALSQEEFDMMLEPIKEDFQAGTQQFVQSMLLPDTDAQLNEWIKADMSAAPPAAALCAMEELMALSISGEAAQIYDEIRIPIVAVNTDMWPVNIEENRKHMHTFELIVINKADHFLMMSSPAEFNKALKQAINNIVEKEGSK
ncbi:alpha/beta fold hydrolase [Bacteroidota bacterium]